MLVSNRRTFLRTLGLGAGAILLGSAARAHAATTERSFMFCYSHLYNAKPVKSNVRSNWKSLKKTKPLPGEWLCLYLLFSDYSLR